MNEKLKYSKINPDDLLDRQFVVIAANDRHVHLRQVGTGAPVDIKAKLMTEGWGLKYEGYLDDV